MTKRTALDINPAARFFSTDQRKELLRQYDYVCAACGCDDIDILECDHWVPFNGENTTIANGVILCSVCNGNKHDYFVDCAKLVKRETIETDSRKVYRLRESANRAAFAQWIKQCGVKKNEKIKKKQQKFKAPW
jgi:hypothetical protein